MPTKPLTTTVRSKPKIIPIIRKIKIPDSVIERLKKRHAKVFPKVDSLILELEKETQLTRVKMNSDRQNKLKRRIRRAYASVDYELSLILRKGAPGARIRSEQKFISDVERRLIDLEKTVMELEKQKVVRTGFAHECFRYVKLKRKTSLFERVKLTIGK
ncbi:MAG: hypothetical protein HOE11_01665 [Candidatus Diapherotrites archaeon]|jgi:hypothetical protein|nr:hypothetical protein [Candidatus Diapherotrites archaeon]